MEFEELLNKLDIPRDVKETIQRKISSIRQIELDLRESEEKYRNLVERANDGIALVQDSLIKYVNPSLAKMTGYTADELYDTPIIDYIHTDFRSDVLNRYEQRVTGQSVPSIYETKILLKHNRVLEVEVNAAIITYQGKPADLAIIRDISERKQVEQALRESEEKYKILFDESPDAITIIGLDGIIQDCNKAASKIFLIPVEEMIGKSYIELDILMEEDVPKYLDFFSRFLNGEDVEFTESRIKRRDNQIRHFKVFPAFIKKDDEILAIQVISRDNTEHKRAEEELRESKEKYQMLVEKLEEGVLLEDAEGVISFINPKTGKLLGYTEEELIGKHWSNIVPSEYFDQVSIETAKRPKGHRTTYEASLLAKDGRHIPVIITATPIFSPKNEFEGVLSVFADITKRKEVEQKLRESEERYRSYIESARDIIFTISPDGILTSINPIVKSITGFTQDEWVGKPFSPLVHEEDLPIIIDGFKRVLEGERLSPAEMRLLTKSEDYVTVEIKASAQVKDGKLAGMLGIARNITERKQAEEALRQVKLEEERYHAMMSHFINNDMQKIINNIELLSLMYESKLELDNNIINQIITIASSSSKTIDTVNKIFEVLQSPFIQPKDSIKLLTEINDIVIEIPKASQLVNINKKNLDARAFIDTRFKDVINELLTFILTSYDGTISVETNINITGSYFPSFFCVYISDCCSQPLPQEIISKLSGTITDEWEIIGHNIGIALASVIMQYYGGLLKIRPSDPKGNVFELRLPKILIE